ncbi:hypothetical protein [Rhizobium johnstonii]|uniref:hypothetical protein n=1 Tax=Rhizobium johnstonii TaxID=3019933 RepID=UPI003F94660F
MREYQTNQLIDRIIDLDARHYAVAAHLLKTICADDPPLAQTWIDLAGEEKDSVDRLGLLILPESVFQVLHSHVRYGYVIEWLGKWSVESFHLKEELADRLPSGWSEVDGVLTAELKSRAQPPKG